LYGKLHCEVHQLGVRLEQGGAALG